MKLTENQFSKKLHKVLKENFKEYVVTEKKSLLYKINIDHEGKLKPANIESPSRGQFAFQTDLLISNDKVPLVVFELKYDGFSTHDVLTYSTKAIKHKEIYPYLRYGFVVGGRETIDRKFFTHNVGFDFALAIDKIENNKAEFIALAQNQIDIAEKLIDILSYNKVSKYETLLDTK